jgi:hypothetical protein
MLVSTNLVKEGMLLNSSCLILTVDGYDHIYPESNDQYKMNVRQAISNKFATENAVVGHVIM